MIDDTPGPDGPDTPPPTDPPEDANLTYAERLERAEAARAAREAAWAERHRRAEGTGPTPPPVRQERTPHTTAARSTAGERRQGPRKVTVAMAALLALATLVIGAVLGMVAAGRGDDPGVTTVQREVQVVTAVPGR